MTHYTRTSFSTALESAFSSPAAIGRRRASCDVAGNGSGLRAEYSGKPYPDYTVRWEGALYTVQREQMARSMRGARVQVERRLDGSRWMQWGKNFVALERCEAR